MSDVHWHGDLDRGEHIFRGVFMLALKARQLLGIYVFPNNLNRLPEIIIASFGTKQLIPGTN